MISPNLESVRTSLHLLSVCVWLGGQIVLAGLVPTLRRTAPDVLGEVAKAFSRLAWPALLVLVLTGAWGLAAEDVASRSSSWTITLAVKLLVVALAVISTLVHSNAKSRIAIGTGAILSLGASLCAAFLGVLLAHVGS